MRGENNQNLGRNLPMNEAKMSRKKFIQYLTDSARLDPKNFKLGNVVIEGEMALRTGRSLLGSTS